MSNHKRQDVLPDIHGSSWWYSGKVEESHGINKLNSVYNETKYYGNYGGYITRHYGNPAGGVHAVQLEISQAGYMGAGGAPALDWKKTGRLVPVIRAMVDRFLEVRP